jgi:hypothetical protein
MLRALAVLFALLALSPRSVAQTCAESVVLSTQEDLDAFDCDIITGDLGIYNLEQGIENLDALLGLRAVEGNVTIYGNALRDLSGLDSLRRIGRELEVVNNRGLETLDGLGSLDSLGSLTISVHPVLQHIDALAGVRSTGDVDITGNLALSTLDGLSGLERVSELFVAGNPSLTDVSALARLRRATELNLTGNTSLSDCSCGIGPLLSAGESAPYSVTIEANAPGCASVEEVLAGYDAAECAPCTGQVRLTTQAEVDAFSCEVVDGALDIEGGPDDPITDLHALDVLRVVEGRLSIWGTTDLVDLDGLSHLQRVGRELDIQGNEALETLDWLADIDSLGGLSISGNPVLREIGGLATVGPAIGDVYITDNDSLRTLEGLSGLEVAGEVYIENNPSLVNVDGLRSLRRVYSLYLRSNPTLDDCSCGLGPLFLVSSGGLWPPTLGGNGAGCNSYQEILDGYGYADCPTCVGPARLRDQADADALTCPIIYGSLYVGGRGAPGPDSLAALSDLYTVQGDLVVQGTPLTSLRGLDGLQDVWGDVDVSFNPDLRRLGSLDALTDLGGNLRMEENRKLARIDGLRALATVPGDVLITNHDSLRAFDGFGSLERVQGDLDLFRLPFVTELDGLAQLRAVGGTLRLSALYRLEHLDALAALDSVYAHLSIGRTDNFFRNRLRSVAGLSGLSYVGGDLVIAQSDSLRTIDGFQNLTEIGGSLVLNDNYNLEDLSGFASLTRTGGVSIAFAGPLRDLDDLSNLRRIDGSLLLLNNSGLTDTEGLTGITEIPGDLSVQIHTALRDVDGLRNVRSVGGDISIAANGGLLNVDGLGGIASVGGGVGVSQNRDLADCSCGLYTLLNEDAVGSGVSIYDNAEGCNSIEEIEEPAPGACPLLTSTMPIEQVSPVALSVYPNPTAGSAQLRFALDRPGEARLAVYDVLGREVSMLVDGPVSGPVERSITEPLPPGLYVARLVTESGREESVRFTVVR